MTDHTELKSTDESTAIDRPSSRTVHQDDDGRRAVPGAKTRTWPLWLAWLLLAAVIAALAFIGKQQLDQLRETDDQLERRKVLTPEDMDQRLLQTERTLESRVQDLRKQTEMQRQLTGKLEERLDDVSGRLLTQDPTGRVDWLIAEAEYLLRLANQRLNMEQDVSGALTILEAADQVLAEADESALYPVRKALASEMTQLRAVGRLDRVGIFLQLESLIQQLEGLDQELFVKDSPLLSGMREEERTEDQKAGEAATAPPSDWKQRVQVALQKLEKYFVIRRRDEPVEPLLAPDQVYYLQQNLRLMLEQAELALLDGNAALFRSSLDKARRWIRRYFVTNEPATRAMLDALDQLSKEKIEADLPDISGSLRTLKGLTEKIYDQRASLGDNAAPRNPRQQGSTGPTSSRGSDRAGENSTESTGMNSEGKRKQPVQPKARAAAVQSETGGPAQ